MTPPLRFGLVGTGFWAGSVHGPALAAHPGTELVGVWGRRAAEAERLAGEFGAQAFTDTEELFSAVDAVAFAVPPDVQAPLAIAAARRGCHLLLEKPIAIDPVAADELVAATEASGVATTVFTTLRFVPAVNDWIAETAGSGDWEGLAGRWVGSIIYPGSPYLESHWRLEWGGLWDLGPHLLSLVLPILGEPERIVATRAARDLVQLDLVHEGGSLSALTMTVTSDPSAAHTTLELWGKAGRTSLPDVFPVEHAEVYAAAVDQLLGSAADPAAPHPCDVRQGRRTVAILSEAQRQLS